jgi:hypothetical protein
MQPAMAATAVVHTDTRINRQEHKVTQSHTKSHKVTQSHTNSQELNKLTQTQTHLQKPHTLIPTRTQVQRETSWWCERLQKPTSNSALSGASWRWYLFILQIIDYFKRIHFYIYSTHLIVFLLLSSSFATLKSPYHIVACCLRTNPILSRTM